MTLRAFFFGLDSFHRLHLGLGHFERLSERLPKLGEDLIAMGLTGLDQIELFFHMAGEFEVHHLWEVLDQEIGDDHAQFRGMKAAFLLLDVAALLDLADDGSVGARSADPLFFQRFDQRSLAVAGRRLREMLRADQVMQIQLLFILQGRQQRVLLLATRRKHAAIAIELKDLALGFE